MPLYLYAFSHATEAPDLKGLNNAPLRTIIAHDVAAVVSTFDKSKVRPRRRHILAHDQAIRGLMHDRSILPISFGTLATSKDEVLGLLEQHQESIASNVARLDGRVEMVARTKVDAVNVVERYVGQYPELREARDRMVAEDQDRKRMMEVGKLFEDLRRRERDSVRETFLAGLEGAYADVRVLDPKSDEEIFDLAFLLGRDEVERWESAVEAVAANLADDLVIHIAGPLPPYSFSTLHLTPASSGA